MSIYKMTPVKGKGVGRNPPKPKKKGTPGRVKDTRTADEKSLDSLKARMKMMGPQRKILMDKIAARQKRNKKPSGRK
jgi:hypothetical protein